MIKLFKKYISIQITLLVGSLFLSSNAFGMKYLQSLKRYAGNASTTNSKQSFNKINFQVSSSSYNKVSNKYSAITSYSQPSWKSFLFTTAGLSIIASQQIQETDEQKTERIVQQIHDNQELTQQDLQILNNLSTKVFLDVLKKYDGNKDSWYCDNLQLAQINVYATDILPIIRNNKKAEELLVHYIEQQFDEIIKTNSGLIFLNSLLFYSRHDLKLLYQFTQNHYLEKIYSVSPDALYPNNSEIQLIKTIITLNPSALDWLKQNTTKPFFFRTFMTTTPCHEGLKRALQTTESTSLGAMMYLSAFLNTCPSEKDLKPSLHTATEQHIFYHIKDLMSDTSGFHKFLIDKKLFSLAEKINDQQKELDQNNFYTFIHGQKWEYFFYTELFKQLYELKYGTPVKDFIFLKTEQPILDATHLKKETTTRLQLLENGCNHENDFAAYNRMFFMNVALFANPLTCSSARYAAENINANPVELRTKNIFHYFGYDNFYEKNKEQIRTLEQNIISSNNHGTLLLCAIPKKEINNFVIPAQKGGVKTTVPLQKWWGYSQTNNMQIIMNSYLKNPLVLRTSNHPLPQINNLEVAMPLTWYKALKPGKIKVFAHTRDQEIIDRTREKISELVKQIK